MVFLTDRYPNPGCVTGGSSHIITSLLLRNSFDDRKMNDCDKAAWEKISVFRLVLGASVTNAANQPFESVEMALNFIRAYVGPSRQLPIRRSLQFPSPPFLHFPFYITIDYIPQQRNLLIYPSYIATFATFRLYLHTILI